MRSRFATPNKSSPPPPAPTPAQTVKDPGSGVSWSVYDCWRGVGARRRVGSVARGVTGSRRRPRGDRLLRRADAEVSGDRIPAASVPRHLAPLAAAAGDPDRVAGQNGRD